MADPVGQWHLECRGFLLAGGLSSEAFSTADNANERRLVRIPGRVIGWRSQVSIPSRQNGNAKKSACWPAANLAALAVETVVVHPIFLTRAQLGTLICVDLRYLRLKTLASADPNPRGYHPGRFTCDAPGRPCLVCCIWDETVQVLLQSVYIRSKHSTLAAWAAFCGRGAS